jgi:hypothetical protein
MTERIREEENLAMTDRNGEKKQKKRETEIDEEKSLRKWLKRECEPQEKGKRGNWKKSKSKPALLKLMNRSGE